MTALNPASAPAPCILHRVSFICVVSGMVACGGMPETGGMQLVQILWYLSQMDFLLGCRGQTAAVA